MVTEVRLSLPNGLGKTVKVLAFSAQGRQKVSLLDAGADYAGGDEIVEQIREGWIDFDKTVATPDMMGSVGKIGKGSGSRGTSASYMVAHCPYKVCAVPALPEIPIQLWRNRRFLADSDRFSCIAIPGFGVIGTAHQAIVNLIDNLDGVSR